ncbi:hypothetical protein [Marinibactrum halimedae]|uniref:Uncharacterized protein n=1 Tax=Marinibactrum halimedae TaxID=1444977 RepID=A0AA37WN62_9GAMM|nr:hypothetical protein [Marinibactrum halimedae]MCD9460583.1 hypothetical protein [Marinibactrum halimedae]GLS27213.1 hypothetical protein GCM10007877_29320 [Marinibactrum halimedae]
MKQFSPSKSLFNESPFNESPFNESPFDDSPSSKTQWSWGQHLRAASMGLFVLSLCACGGGGGGSSSSGATPTPAPVQPSFDISGTAAKGVIVGGVVNAYPIVEGIVDTSNSLGSATSDENGNYSITIDNFEDQPIVVRIQPAEDGSTIMKCDITGGCGDGIPFGGDFPLTDTSFVLDAMIPTPTGEEIVTNISTMTNVATSVALEAIAVGDDVDDAIEDANTSVANRFGLTGDVTLFSIVDLTDPAAVAEADDDDLEFNLYSSAIVRAVLTDNASADLVSAIALFAEQYVEQDGLADREEDGAEGVTLADILTAASLVIDDIELEAEDEGIEIDIAGLEVEFDTQADFFSMFGSFTPSEGTPIDSDTDGLQVTKDFVADIRTIALSTDLVGEEPFADELALVEGVFNDDTALLLEAVEMAVSAIEGAMNPNVAVPGLPVDGGFTDLPPITDPSIGLQPVTYTDSVSGVEVAISEEAQGTQYQVNQIVPVMNDAGVAVDVSVAITIFDEGSLIDDSTGDESLRFDVSATIGETVSLVSEAGYLSLLESASGEDSTIEFGALSIAPMITQLSGADPITFEGFLELSLISAELDDIDVEEELDEEDLFEDLLEAFEGEFFELSLGGTFSSASGSRVSGSISLLSAGAGEEDQFNSVAVSFLTAIEGVSDEVAVLFFLEDGELEESATFSIHFDDVSLSVQAFESDEASQVFIVNQDNVVLSYSEVENDDNTISAEGFIVVGEDVFADISARDGVIMIAYSDGSFESL